MDKEFKKCVRKAIENLKLVTTMYGREQVSTIMEVKMIIEELESIVVRLEGILK